MARYIDADAFTNVLKGHIEYLIATYGNESAVEKTLATVIDEMNAFPSVDVQEVKHGHWEHDTGIWSNFEICSLCKQWTKSSFEYDYCPNCGAKMDLKGE